MPSSDSILKDIKKMIGAPEEECQFDSEIITDINAAFGLLDQLGAGPYNGFQITGYDETWEVFSTDVPLISLVKQYIMLQVKVMFDGSSMGSSYMNIIKEMITQLEWRINVYVDKF